MHLKWGAITIFRGPINGLSESALLNQDNCILTVIYVTAVDAAYIKTDVKSIQLREHSSIM